MRLPNFSSGEVPPAVLVVAAVVVIILIISIILLLLPEDTGRSAEGNETRENITDGIIGQNVTEIPECADPDGGKNLLQQGTATSGMANGTDSCLNSSHITEFFCENNALANETAECPSGYMCSAGACIPKLHEVIMCQDSDEGQEPTVAGRVTYLGKEYPDECVMINQVKEYYCQDKAMQSTNYVCDPGFQCSEGACVEQPANCTDSDYGKNKTVKGMVTIYKGLTLMTMESDSCVDESSVREYFCSGDFLGSEIMHCGEDYGCDKGACVFQSCQDSDGGQNLLKKGIVSKGTVSEDDECDGLYNVVEYYCSDNKIQSTVNTCPSGYWCQADECVPEPDCKDTDSGKDYYNTGTVTKGTLVFTDSCKGDDLTEYFCDGKIVKNETVSCLGTGLCSSGSCIVK